MDVLIYIVVLAAVFVVVYIMTRRVFRLSKKVREQAREIKHQNRILEQQNNKLVELDLEKSQLVSVVSHDLKSPLNQVFALTNLITMEEDNLSVDQKDYINRIHRVVSEGLSLIRNLLDIRAIEDKGMNLKIESLELSKIVKALSRSFRDVAKRKEIQLEFKETDIYVVSDRQYLLRILENVISNAIKYTPIGGKVVVDLYEKEGWVYWDVVDEGPGILKEEQKRLYNKYEVLSSRPTGGENSTGLGLSIAKSLIERLGGSIQNKNRSEGGSVFTVQMPREVDV